MGVTSPPTIPARLIATALLVLGLQTSPAFSQTDATTPDTIASPGHFYSGNDYLRENNYSQQIYLAGITDGFMGAAFFGASERSVTKMNGCLKRKLTTQLQAMVSKYLGEHPERWDEPMSILTYNALNISCAGFYPLVKSD